MRLSLYIMVLPRCMFYLCIKQFLIFLPFKIVNLEEKILILFNVIDYIDKAFSLIKIRYLLN